jgi:hypothetical protein
MSAGPMLLSLVLVSVLVLVLVLVSVSVLSAKVWVHPVAVLRRAATVRPEADPKVEDRLGGRS